MHDALPLADFGGVLRSRPELHDKRHVLGDYTREAMLTEGAKRAFVKPERKPLSRLDPLGCGIPGQQ
jgi:hypothetical protein